MSWLLYALIALMLLDALRMRGRASAFGVLGDATDGDGFQVVTAPGVTVADATRAAAIAYARAQQVDVVDLVPRDLPTVRALGLLQLVDPRTYRTDRLGPGRTAGHAVVISDDVAERARVRPVKDDVEFAREAFRIKHYGTADLVVAPGERAGAIDLGQRYEVLRTMMGPATAISLVVLTVFWALIGIGIWLAPLQGLIALGVWQLQPALALVGTKLAPRDLAVVTLLRAPVEIYTLLRTVLGRRQIDAAASRRPAYTELLAGGIDRFYEPRRETCLLCGSNDLVVHVRSRDLLQHKPGRFTLERCRACGHVFQNPRLSLAGLDFYYKDFYDGLGEAGMEFVFGFGAEPYHARARMVREVAQPRRWLDVGAGHGHFCVAARRELPDTQFDGLDFSESIDEAKRRGWVATAYRGLFPELAPELAGRYDAISMSHYLEHTLDPRAELDAARTALASNGTLMIEVPDPEFGLSRLLRRYWLPYFQPQHLHLLSAGNLEKLLRERGFTPLVWHRGEAHQKVDFFFAAYLFLDGLAPPRRLPWRWRSAGASAWRGLIWTAGLPLLASGILVDNLIGPVFSRAKVSNTYRVLARRE